MRERDGEERGTREGGWGDRPTYRQRGLRGGRWRGRRGAESDIQTAGRGGELGAYTELLAGERCRRRPPCRATRLLQQRCESLLVNGHGGGVLADGEAGRSGVEAHSEESFLGLLRRGQRTAIEAEGARAVILLGMGEEDEGGLRGAVGDCEPDGARPGAVAILQLGP